MNLRQTWRWYGPEDSVSLDDVKQAGASGIVSALHHIPSGEIWSKQEIRKRKQIIKKAGLTWDVVESVNVDEAIKTRTGNYKELMENYRTSLQNLAEEGIRTVCYNFMPVLDWTRTQLDYKMPNGAKALYFDWTDLAVFDIFLLKRKGAETAYLPEVLEKAKARYENYSSQQKETLKTNILMGIPGEASTSTDQLLESVDIYDDIGADGLKDNLVYFLNGIKEVCEEHDIKMTIHPDDPPMSILGLPRIVSTKEDLKWIFSEVDSSANGLCFCTGSLGSGKQNNLVDILKEVGDRVHFVHLRNVVKKEDNSFYESDHLDGDNDMYGVMKELLKVQAARTTAIPYRSDHGHQMLDDLHKTTNPGYSAIGRLRGLAELRGLELGISGEIEKH